VKTPLARSTVVRIPPGELAPEADRQRWREALAGRPDLQRRLVDGLPSLILEGKAVLEAAWNRELHVAKERLPVVPGTRLILGHDGGLTPATVVLQWNGPQLQVLAGLQSQRAGTEEHLTEMVLPWLARNAPENEVEHWLDPAMFAADQSSVARSAAQVIRRIVGGNVREGPTKWPPRRDAFLAVLGRLVNARPALLVSLTPDTEWLLECCERWHYPLDRQGQVLRDGAEKDEASHVMDALTYAVCGAKPWRVVELPSRGVIHATLGSKINPVHWGPMPRVRVRTLPWGYR
jgi:hypothetical protein